jgi:ElaB/YqjD/DUF883 family membrane-anchored ribosome-binding protein
MENRQPMGSETSNQRPDDSMRQATERGRQYYEELKDRTRETARGAVQQTREYAEDAVQRASDKMTEYREGGFEKVMADVTTYTQRQPVPALLIAAGVGLLLGLLMRGSVADVARHAYDQAAGSSASH